MAHVPGAQRRARRLSRQRLAARGHGACRGEPQSRRPCRSRGARGPRWTCLGRRDRGAHVPESLTCEPLGMVSVRATGAALVLLASHPVRLLFAFYRCGCRPQRTQPLHVRTRRDLGVTLERPRVFKPLQSQAQLRPHGTGALCPFVEKIEQRTRWHRARRGRKRNLARP
eukprot:Amastigsp_a842269_7.p4 type:complete len:170 gc:universal Amastigsp_a842269_7:375-884(+)